MKRNSTLGLLAYAVAFSMITLLIGCKATTEQAVDQSTPEASVREFYHALNNDNIDTIDKIMDETSVKASKVSKGLRESIKHGIHFRVSNLEVNTWKNTGEVAQVGTRLYEQILQDDQIIAEGDSGELFGLTKRNGKWYISTFDGD